MACGVPKSAYPSKSMVCQLWLAPKSLVQGVEIPRRIWSNSTFAAISVDNSWRNQRHAQKGLCQLHESRCESQSKLSQALSRQCLDNQSSKSKIGHPGSLFYFVLRKAILSLSKSGKLHSRSKTQRATRGWHKGGHWTRAGVGYAKRCATTAYRGV